MDPKHKELVSSIFAVEAWIIEHLLDDDKDDKLEPLWAMIDRSKIAVCAIYGHVPTMDHCMIPEHDFCEVCNELTPNQAPRKPK